MIIFYILTTQSFRVLLILLYLSIISNGYEYNLYGFIWFQYFFSDTVYNNNILFMLIIFDDGKIYYFFMIILKYFFSHTMLG